MRHIPFSWKTAFTAAFLLLLYSATIDKSYAVDIDYLNYSQGGIVVDGVAYFTGSGSDVGAFNASTLQMLDTYEIGGRTYDSSPLVYQKKDGSWLVIAHDIENERTRALYRDTGEVAWTSAANQPGVLFFGYSYYQQPDGSRLIMTPSGNGLHAMSGETGQDAWYLPAAAYGAVTPAVDQENGWVFYQSNGQVHKINATNGSVLKSVGVATPTLVTSYNTVLTKDENGSFVATYWYGDNMWDGAIRVYDENLNLKWQKTGLPTAKKNTLTYANGLLVAGSGNHWGATYDQNDPTWKKIVAYNIADGSVAWITDLSSYTYTSILNVPYYNGYFYAETQDSTTTTPGVTSKLFRINASNGQIEDVLDYGVAHTSCATSIIADGKLFSGDIPQNRVFVTELATGSSLDWVGPFGDPQLNQMALPDDPDAVLVPMREITEPFPNINITLDVVDNGCPETGLHSYTITATGPGITTLGRFTIDGEVYQVFDSEGNPSEWLGDNSASASETTDSYVIFGDMRLPDLGGTVGNQVTEETINDDGNTGLGTLNNYNESLGTYDVYMELSEPSIDDETVALIQVVVVDGCGFAIDLSLHSVTGYNPDTGEGSTVSRDLSLSLPTLIMGDADGDGFVDADDATILAQHWLQSGTWADGDFSRDGIINDIDAALLAVNWGRTADYLASVPEPSMLILFSTMILVTMYVIKRPLLEIKV